MVRKLMKMGYSELMKEKSAEDYRPEMLPFPLLQAVQG